MAYKSPRFLLFPGSYKMGHLDLKSCGKSTHYTFHEPHCRRHKSDGCCFFCPQPSYHCRIYVFGPDTTQAYDIALMLRHTEQYNYQNLWFFIQCGDSLSPIQSDTVMACLADDRGQWLGTRAGRYYSGYVIMERELTFPQAGAYTFAIVHGMRDSLIHGIADVGLELRKHDYGKE